VMEEVEIAGSSAHATEEKAMKAFIVIKPTAAEAEAELRFKIENGIIIPTELSLNEFTQEALNIQKATTKVPALATATPKATPGTSYVALLHPKAIPNPLKPIKVYTHKPSGIPAPIHSISLTKSSSRPPKTPQETQKTPQQSAKLPTQFSKLQIKKPPVPVQRILEVNPLAARELTFSFGRILDERSTNKQIYENVVNDQIDKAIVKGQDLIFFAYGRPASGKTRLLVGEPGVHGIFHRVATQIDKFVSSIDSGWKYLASVSMFDSVTTNTSNIIKDLNSGRQVILRDQHGKFVLENFQDKKADSMTDWKAFFKIAREWEEQGQKAVKNGERKRSSLIIRIQTTGDQFNGAKGDTPKQTKSIIYLMDLTPNDQYIMARAVEETNMITANHFSSLLKLKTEPNRPPPLQKLSDLRTSSILKLMEPFLQGTAMFVVFCCVALNDFKSRKTFERGMSMAKLPYHGKKPAPFCPLQHEKSVSVIRKIIEELKEETARISKMVPQGMIDVSQPGCSQNCYAAAQALAELSIKHQHTMSINVILEQQAADYENQLKGKNEEVVQLQTSMNILRRENELLRAELVDVEEKFKKQLQELQRQHEEKNMIQEERIRMQEEKIEKQGEKFKKLEEKQRQDSEKQQQNIDKLTADMKALQTAKTVPKNLEPVPNEDNLNNEQESEVEADEEESDEAFSEPESPEEHSDSSDDDEDDCPLPKEKTRKGGISKRHNANCQKLIRRYVRRMPKDREMKPQIEQLLMEFLSEDFWMTQIHNGDQKAGKTLAYAAKRYCIRIHGREYTAWYLGKMKFSDTAINYYLGRAKQMPRSGNYASPGQ
ncbi:Kinesin-5, partial [Orchesella cincta]